MSEDHHQRTRLQIGDVFPLLPPERYEEAEANIRAHLELALRVYDRICRDPKEYQRFKTLTRVRSSATIHGVDSSSSNLNQEQ
jgi:hypothetical protein